MSDFARRFLSWMVLSLAFFIESFWTLTGMAAITYGVGLIYVPAGWIVGGVLLVMASEFAFGFSSKKNVNGANSGTI